MCNNRGLHSNSLFSSLLILGEKHTQQLVDTNDPYHEDYHYANDPREDLEDFGHENEDDEDDHPKTRGLHRGRWKCKWTYMRQNNTMLCSSSPYNGNTRLDLLLASGDKTPRISMPCAIPLQRSYFAHCTPTLVLPRCFSCAPILVTRTHTGKRKSGSWSCSYKHSRHMSSRSSRSMMM